MSLETERCESCGNAMVSMDTDPEVIRARICPRCAAQQQAARRWARLAVAVGIAILAAIVAMQVLA